MDVLIYLVVLFVGMGVGAFAILAAYRNILMQMENDFWFLDKKYNETLIAYREASNKLGKFINKR